MGKIFLVMGKSATGKDHIYREVLRKLGNSIKPVVGYTTRPMREGETHGVEYRFVTTDEMKAMTDRGIVIESRCYNTVMGPWHYFTCDDGQINPQKHNSILIVTPSAYEKLLAYFGGEYVRAVYIESPDADRILRSVKREQKQEYPNIKEVCRRYLADEEDFAEDYLNSLGITKRFINIDFDRCVEEVVEYIIKEGGINPGES
ncbi:MAG: guanylate kinase [Clostridiales bacterium]|nr:guanylate kinase [Clostridiales bacterium]